MTELEQKIGALLDKCDNDPTKLSRTDRDLYDELTADWYEENRPPHPSQTLSCFI